MVMFLFAGLTTRQIYSLACSTPPPHTHTYSTHTQNEIVVPQNDGRFRPKLHRHQQSMISFVGTFDTWRYALI